MISFECFPLEEGIPIYLQIIRHVKRGIVAGIVRDGDELPSGRVLSARLGVNPNTVQKAYRLLEEEGVITSHAGAKSAVSLDAGAAGRIRAQLLEQEGLHTVRSLRQMGVGREEALALIGRLWEEKEADE